MLFILRPYTYPTIRETPDIVSANRINTFEYRESHLLVSNGGRVLLASLFGLNTITSTVIG